MSSDLASTDINKTTVLLYETVNHIIQKHFKECSREIPWDGMHDKIIQQIIDLTISANQTIKRKEGKS